MERIQPFLVILLLLACAFTFVAIWQNIKQQAEQVPIIPNNDYIEFNYQTVFNVPAFNPGEGSCLPESSLRSRSPTF